MRVMILIGYFITCIKNEAVMMSLVNMRIICDGYDFNRLL